jgi:UDP-N-acetylmuramoylalanine--D-glutamate ligase
MHRVATTFSGVAHRLELVSEENGVRWYNDSIATTPERVVAALKAFATPVILLAGGRDKHLSWGEMADLALKKARSLILFGEAADLIAMQIEAARQRATSLERDLPVYRCARLEEAVDKAACIATQGDIVLLAPGGTSFDAYRDFEERGQHFRDLVNAL